MRIARNIAVIAASAGIASGCRREDPNAHRTLSLHPCHLAHVGVETTCGTFEVFEDRARGAGRKVTLNVAVMPALVSNPEPDPLFILAGGPGQAATTVAPALAGVLERVRKRRDIVFVDQRGTGKSNPLECPRKRDLTLAERLDSQPNEDELKGCLAAYDADPRLYTTSIAMDDLDEVRAALGYERINLWGGSYGTRAALVYMRQHEARVRTATLDGVAPFTLELPLSVARDGQRALDAMFGACAADHECSKTFPDLRDRFEKLLASLREHPVDTVVAHPVTGEPTKVTIRAPHFAGIVRGLLYFPEIAAQLPLTIERASRGDYAAFAAQAWWLGSSAAIASGMFLSVVCAEDVPFATPEKIAAATHGTFLGADGINETIAACRIWPRGSIPAGYREPVTANVPTLVLSGELDPVTPPSYGEETKAHLPQGEHRVVMGVGHGTTASGACVANLFADFVETGTAKGKDPECLRANRRPPFSVSFAGTSP